MILMSSRKDSTRLVHNLTGGQSPNPRISHWFVTEEDLDACRLTNGYVFRLDRVSKTWRTEWTVLDPSGEVLRTGKSRTVFGLLSNINRTGMLV